MPATPRSRPPRRRRDPTATRERILVRAEKLFTERGYNGVSIGDIAAAAKVGKSLVMHHGGSKDELWTQIKQRRIAAYAAGQQAALEQVTATPGLLEQSLRAYFLWLRANPGYLRLMAWRDLEQRTGISEPERQLLDLSRQRMREAHAAGWLHPDLDPELALFAVFAMLEAWFMSGKRACFTEHEDDERYLATVFGMLRGGLITRSEATCGS